MSGIHNDILHKIRDHLQIALITNIDKSDKARAGIIQIGPLQDVDPDQARISITIHENDPDQFISGAPTTQDKRWWDDEVEEIEIGFAITTIRKFSMKIRCMFERTREKLDLARDIASTIRTRVEHELPKISFSGINADGEYVSRGILSSDIYGEMIQSGGPPDSYDFLIKFQFNVLTTKAM